MVAIFDAGNEALLKQYVLGLERQARIDNNASELFFSLVYKNRARQTPDGTTMAQACHRGLFGCGEAWYETTC